MESHKVSRLAYRQESPAPNLPAGGNCQQRDSFAQGQPNLIHKYGNRRGHGQSRPGKVITRTVVDGEEAIRAQLDLTTDGGLILAGG
jgi:hypothetical protein